MVKNLLAIILSIGPAMAERPGVESEYPAVAQPRIERKLEGLPTELRCIDEVDISFDKKTRVYLTYSNFKGGENSLRFKNYLESNSLIKPVTDRREHLKSKVDIQFINADDYKTRLDYRIPLSNTHPLVKINNGRWEKFPEEHSRCFLHPIWMLEWLEYQHAVLIDHIYSDMVDVRTRIQIFHENERNTWLYEKQKQAFFFLINKGVNPTAYQHGVNETKDHHYYSYQTHIIYFKYSKKMVFFNSWNPITKKDEKKSTYRNLYLVFRDHNFEKIKQDFPDFDVVDEKYSDTIIKLDPHPDWSDKKFAIKQDEVLIDVSLTELYNKMGYGWRDYSEEMYYLP